jgi:hypothetical protein
MGRRRGRSARRQPWPRPSLKQPLESFKRPWRVYIRWHVDTLDAVRT